MSLPTERSEAALAPRYYKKLIEQVCMGAGVSCVTEGN